MLRLIKTPILVLVLMASGIAAIAQTSEKPVKQGKIEVIFNRKLQFNDMVKIKLDVADKGISLDYQKLEFDENGGLLAIDFKVNCNDGYAGSAQMSDLTNRSKFGFYRDYTQNATAPFGTGKME